MFIKPENNQRSKKIITKNMIQVILFILIFLTAGNSKAGLSASQTNDNTVVLTWTAVGDDNHSGLAAQYDIRYSTEPLSEQNWSSAIQIDTEPIPGQPGTVDSCVIYSLLDDTTYYFAIKCGDEVPNWSTISNIVSVTCSPIPMIPEANFAVDKSEGFAPLSVSFTGFSSGNPNSCYWIFGDSVTSVEENPIHIYQEPGLYTVSLTVTNDSGTDDTTIIDYINVLEPISQTSDSIFASNDILVKASIEGSYLNTFNADNQFEIIGEKTSGGKPSKRYSITEHRWAFVVPTMSGYVFNIKGFRDSNSEGDDFLFEYSMDNSIFIPLLTINSDVNQYYSAQLPSNIGETLFVRVVDTDHSGGNLTNNYLYVDHMFINSTTGLDFALDTIFVQGLQVVRESTKGNRIRAKAVVSVHNINNEAVIGALVIGQFNGPSSSLVSGYTGNNGSVEFISSAVKNPQGDWNFSVDDIVLTGVVYEPNINNISYAIEDPNEKVLNGLPNSFNLAQNYPNPFNPSTNISFDIPKPVLVNLEIYNIAGQLVTTLASRKFEAGSHTIEWNSTNNSGSQISSGVYIYRINAGEYSESKKMVLMK